MSTAGVPHEVKSQGKQLQRNAEQAVRKASPWIVRLGRFGLTAKGAVYLIIGALALQAAYYGGSEFVDSQGALHSILRQPFGALLLGVLCAGLLSYTAWRFVQAIFNPEGEDHDLKGWSKRIFRLFSGIVYSGLGVAAARLLIGLQVERRTPSDWSAMLLRQPFGKWLVVIAGLVVIGVGLFRIYKAWSGELKKQLVLDRYAARAREWITAMGRLGQGARGIVFVIMGSFMCFAGLHTNPSEAKGVREALAFIERAPYGPYLLGGVAIGLIAYGLFQFVEARYRRIAAT